MLKVLGLGDNTVDVYLDQGQGFPGGNAVNVSVFCSRQNAEAAYMGVFGSDSLGERLIDSLNKEAVDTSLCQVMEGPNAWACVQHCDGDRHCLGSDPGVCKQLSLSTEQIKHLADYDLVHTSSYSGMDTYLKSIRENCTTLSYDLSDDWADEQFRNVCSQVDLVFLSANDRTEEECRALAERCSQCGAEHIVITRSNQGALAYVAGEFYWQEVIQTEVKDTMGAGDGFIAAYLIAWSSAQPTQVCLAQGAEYADLVCRQQGAFGYGFSIADDFHDALKAKFQSVPTGFTNPTEENDDEI